MAKEYYNKTPYAKSILDFRNKPGYSTGEGLMSSLHRWVFSLETSGQVRRARVNDVQENLTLLTKLLESTGEADKLSWFVKQCRPGGALRLPKRGNQKRTEVPFIGIVPELALITNAPREKASSNWNPVAFVEQLVCAGTDAPEKFRRKLFDALRADTDEDDPVARYVLQKLANQLVLRDSKIARPYYKFDGNTLACCSGLVGGSPAIQFVEDMQRVFHLKRLLTRRQWLACVESIIRIGAVSFALWILHVNRNTQIELRRLMQTDHDISLREDLAKTVFELPDSGLLRYGEEYKKPIETLNRNYIYARDWLGFVLHELNEKGIIGDSITTVEQLQDIFVQVNKADRAVLDPIVKSADEALSAEEYNPEPNLGEFIKHLLHQFASNDPGSQGIDQSFWAKATAPDKQNKGWVIASGAASALVLAHCAVKASAGNDATVCTIKQVAGHLAKYGIQAPVSGSQLTQENLLRSYHEFGLTMDSPDAEQGAMVRDPFYIGAL